MEMKFTAAKRCPKMKSKMMIYTALLFIVSLYTPGVEASSISSESSNSSELKTSVTSTKEDSNHSSKAISTSYPRPAVNQKYWTAFINISYVHISGNGSKRMYHTDNSETGRYSTSLPIDVRGLAIKLVSENSNQSNNNNSLHPEENGDITGCFPPFLDNYPRNESWIAVVKRGHCTFNEKIKNALDLNASGILVYDNEERQPLQSMKVEQFPGIASVFTYNWKGREILRKINSGFKVYLDLQKASHCQTEEPRFGPTPSVLLCVRQDEYPHFRDMLNKHSPFWNWAGNGRGINGTGVHGQKRTSVLFVSVSFIILMLISLAWLIFYYVQRFRYIHAKDQLERKLCSQAKRALQIISTSVLKKDDLEAKDFFDTCAVCIENYRVEDIVRILPCKHQFHKSCIDQWLLEKRTCPMCKMDILKHYGLVTDKKKSKKEDDDANPTEPHEETSMNQMA